MLMEGGMKHLRVSKWVGQVPVVGVCTLCNREFKIPMTAMNRVSDAQESLRLQFAQHVRSLWPTWMAEADGGIYYFNAMHSDDAHLFFLTDAFFFWETVMSDRRRSRVRSMWTRSSRVLDTLSRRCSKVSSGERDWFGIVPSLQETR
jgi:hypothetical protein